jgi:serine/threonine protein kinase
MNDSLLSPNFVERGTFGDYTFVRCLWDGPSPFFHVRSRQQDDLALQVVSPGSSAAWQKHAIQVLKTIRHVRHPHLSTLLEIATLDGLLYATTSLPMNGFLEEKIQLPFPSVEEAAYLVERVARAVQALHSRHILHRNLGPHSIALTHDGSPLVMDYTLASPDWRSADYLEAQGQILGRLGYIAPEQAFARRTEIGPATDVYSLGACLYRMLTGRLPLGESNDSLSLLGKLDSDDVAPPSQLRTDLPVELESICLRCLERRAQDRFNSAEKLANELRKYLKMEIPLPQSTNWWTRWRQAWRGEA